MAKDDEFFDSDSDSAPDEAPATQRRDNKGKKGKKHTGKHAPTVASTKRPVSKIREIPGLQGKKQASLYRDIRFDAAYGKVNYERIRNDYKFLDEYRTKEIDEMDGMLKNKKLMNRMDEGEVENLKYEDQSLKSRMGHLKQEQFEKEALQNYKKETGKKWIKRSERRNVVRVAKFESMNGKQRRKTMERKRKRKLGKEMKSFAFSK
ncbi:DEKNAAC105528 [Brettanomyces naardenensis]|uniref:rRNA biogenesis protein RRP36 n=1 Tax=Brettanomyces naardenensis TaxID=13370 RepID=A0A448YU43_BRENA|nr:DEKNAAC105528 [Brettanomyces naardenensis]